MSPSDAQAFEADYFDGRAAARHRVSVARHGDTVHIAGDGVLLDVPLAELHFHPRVGRLPMRIGLRGRGLLVADGDAVSASLPVPRVTSLAQRLERHAGMLAVSIVGVVVALLLTWEYAVPWIARQAAEVLPVRLETELGDEGLKQLDRFAFHPSDLPQARRDEIAGPFEQMRRIEGTQATLLFRKGGFIGPNAFALPGARIVVTDELIAAMDDDDLVMAVLAHELGHVAHHHAMRQLLQSSLVAVGSVLLLGDVTAVSGLAAAIPTVLLHNSYSRDLEREADAYAFALLVRSGRSPRQFAQALTALQRAVSGKRSRGDVPSFLATHPSTKERVRAARDAAP